MRVRVETKARRIECIGQGQVPELFYSAHVSLNAGEGSVVLYLWHSSDLTIGRALGRW